MSGTVFRRCQANLRKTVVSRCCPIGQIQAWPLDGGCLGGQSMRTGERKTPRWLQVLIREIPGGRYAIAALLAFLLICAGSVWWTHHQLARYAPIAVAQPNPQPDPLGLIKAQIQPGPVTAAEQRELRALLWEAYPIRPAQATDTMDFYFDFKPMQCGTVGGARVAHRRRFISRNGAVLLEGDLSSRSFEEFWLICQAAGTP